MYFLFFILLLIAAFIYALFSDPMKIYATFNSDTMVVNIKAVWLSFLKIHALATDAGARISVSVFNIRVFSKERSGAADRDLSTLRKAIRFDDIRLELSYSLNEPQTMGFVAGAVSTFGSLYGINDLKLYPNFISFEPYIRIWALLKLNLGKTLANFLMPKRNTMKMNRRKAWTVPT